MSNAKIRVYYPEVLSLGKVISLKKNISHRLLDVMRLKKGNQFVLFNGAGLEYLVELIETDKQTLSALVLDKQLVNNESPLQISLGQAIARTQKMDFIIQKTTELGVSSITPLISAHCAINTSKERENKRQTHLQRILESAVEQSGRSHLPTLNNTSFFENWVEQANENTKLIFHHEGNHALNEVKLTKNVAVLIGPEGGWSPEELKLAQTHGFKSVTLGPRVLRMETAAIGVVSCLQLLCGDLGRESKF